MTRRFADNYSNKVLPPPLRDVLETACGIVLDELFDDVAALTGWGPTEITPTYGDALAATQAIADLPNQYRAWYSVRFAKWFLLAAGRVVQGLTSGNKSARPLCTAEELALNLMLDRTEFAAESLDVDLEPHAFGYFRELCFEDDDFAFLYEFSEAQREALAKSPTAGMPDVVQPIETWFEPFFGGKYGTPIGVGDPFPAIDLVTGQLIGDAL